LSSENVPVQPTLLPGEVSTFYQAYNLGGGEIIIDNHIWQNGRDINANFE